MICQQQIGRYECYEASVLSQSTKHVCEEEFGLETGGEAVVKKD